MKDFLTNSVFFGAVISLVAYEIGTLLKKKFKLAIFNPLLIAVICVMAVLILFPFWFLFATFFLHSA